MASVVDICNSALNMLGGNTIISLTETSKNARLCNQRYELVRDAVFREHPWNCLQKRVELAQDTVAPSFEFSSAYTLPADCLRVLRSENSNFSNNERFRIEGRKLLTDESSIKILYVAAITDTTQYDASLIETLSARLAAELAYPITQSSSLMDRMFSLYQQKLKDARFADATEGTVDDETRIQADDFINARL
jgi:hypothetical protein|tara:strand:- start:2702 stop:3280 length:579 start_codon:yes stop_codon:yes gene_type:complete